MIGRKVASNAVFLMAVVSLAGCAAGGGKPEEIPAIVEGNTQFALDLYGRLKAGEGNVFVSPYSLSTALAMTYAGARGETAREMAETLHFPHKPDSLDPGFEALIASIQGRGSRRYQLSTANALWGRRGEPYLSPYLKGMKNHFGAGLREVDFGNDATGAAETINRWVEDQTRGKIKDLVSPSMLGPSTALVLTNAVYFKGDWLHGFSETMTRKDDIFFVSDDRKVSVPMMRQTGTFRYFDGGPFQALELPYVGDDLSMIVLLPKEADGLAALEESFTSKNLTRWLSKLAKSKVAVELPRFTLSQRLDLKDVLSAMGMPLAFDGKKADFSGVNGQNDLFLSAVLQKAFVEVNEKGTEAAVATVVEQAKSAPGPDDDLVFSFRADHPFVFMIRDKHTGSILFLGRLADPRS
jgi:serpin B